MNTAALVIRARKGDQQALTELYNISYKPAYAVAFKMTGNEDDAFDVLQDAYIKAFNSLDQLTDPSGFIPWFNKITANKCRDFLRSKKNVIMFSDMEYDSGEDSFELEYEDESTAFQPEERADYSDTKRLVAQMLDNLPPDQKMVLLMYYVQEMSIKEIAEALDVSENTVKSRMSYGKKKMRAQAEDLEKKGYKLRVSSVTVIPFLIWMLHEFTGMVSVHPMSAVIGAAAGTTAAGTTAAGTTAVGTTAGTAAAGTVATTTAGTAAGTAAAGTAAGSAAGTTAAAGVSAKAVALIAAGAVAVSAGAAGFFGFVLPAMRGNVADTEPEVTPYSCTYDRGNPPAWQKRSDSKIYLYVDPAVCDYLQEVDFSLVDNRFFQHESIDINSPAAVPVGGFMHNEGNNIWSCDLGITLDDNQTYTISFHSIDTALDLEKDFTTCELIIGNDCFGDMVYLTGGKVEDISFSSKEDYIVEWVNADPSVYATIVRITSSDNVIGELLPKGDTFYSMFCRYLHRYSYIDDNSLPNEKSDKQTIEEVAKTLGLTDEERDRALREAGFTEKDGAWIRSDFL